MLRHDDRRQLDEALTPDRCGLPKAPGRAAMGVHEANRKVLSGLDVLAKMVPVRGVIQIERPGAGIWRPVASSVTRASQAAGEAA